MAGSSIGTVFRITTWGESHGAGIGVVVDGCPAGLTLCEADIQSFLDRRRPGQHAFATARKESDQVCLLSGVFEGRTTGTPITMMVHNEDQRSRDYSGIASIYRPGHADYTFTEKYGFRDYRGGGRSSGRETLARVAGGAVAMKLLSSLGIQADAWVESVGPITCETFSPEIIRQNPLCMPDAEAAQKAAAHLEECMAAKDSCGAVVACRIKNVPAGLGDPVFEKLSANLAKAICSIGAVKGFEMGEGFGAARLKGSENNDGFAMTDGVVTKLSNHSGGTLGGISDGGDLFFRAAFKPTPSIYAPQQTVNADGEEVICEIKGRHDPIIAPRAVVVVEAMAALVVADALLLGMTSTMDKVHRIYRPEAE